MSLLLLSSLASLSHAADVEVNVEIGRLDVAAGDFDVFDWNEVQMLTGVRAEYHKSSRLAFSASYAHFVTGAHNSVYDYWDYEGDGIDAPGASEGFDAALRGHVVGLGARGGVDLWGWLNPYGLVELRGLHAAVRLDDDTHDDDNPNQITVRGTTLGAVAAAGLDIRIPLNNGWAISHNLEAGYEIMAPLNIGSLGAVAFRGAHVRAGVGMRF